MGPLAAERQRDRVEGYIAKGIADGATLAAGGGRPKDLGRGWYVEPTVFGNVDNHSVIVQEEIFGPVLSVIPAQDEEDAIRIANDTTSSPASAARASARDCSTSSRPSSWSWRGSRRATRTPACRASPRPEGQGGHDHPRKTPRGRPARGPPLAPGPGGIRSPHAANRHPARNRPDHV